ncbi:MAG: family 78 glycoside hydrolase catalytic domain [Planctomycetes bacterium]|nr:family 78 glycoside hydrolase catalytic domain [Planctomycetota bacterium]
MNRTNVEWTARWIQSSLCGGPRTGAPAPFFRHEFTVSGKPREVHLYITAFGLYEARVNGETAHDTVFTPGWTVFDKRVRYQCWDISDLIQEGENVIGVILGDGWYCGHVAKNDRQYYGDRPKLLAQIEWTTEEGQIGKIGSDEGWLTAPGPILQNDLIMGESYDARKEFEGWDTPGFDDSNWQNARPVDVGDIVVEPQYGPFVRRHECITAKKLNPREGNARLVIYDLGQNISGRVRITVQGERGMTVRLRHAEMLDSSGQIYTENLRSARATDYYTLKGDGLETWEPRFTFHGFRYVEVSWTPPREPGSIESVEGIALYSDLPRTGTFECSHSLLNQLYENTVWGQKGNFLEVPTDCPQRDERLGWTGDAQVFIRTAAFNMDVSDFFRKWLRDMRDAQSSDGAIPPYIPFTASFGSISDGGPAWADAAMICPMEMYRAYGEIDFIAEHYDCMVGYMDYLAANKVKDGVRGHPDVDSWGGFGDWLALDGSGRTSGGTPKDLIGTAFYANNARILAECAGILGKGKDVRRWTDLQRETARVFRERFVTPDGLMAAGTQTACVLALYFDLVTDEQRSGTIGQIVNLIERNGMKIGTGFVGASYLLDALEEAGRLDIAYALLEQEEFPSWLFPVKNGATTIWERWDGWTPEKGFQDPGMNSFNHYAYGAVCDWMVSTVAGLEPAEPGYKRIRFRPRPGGSLSHAGVRLETRYGTAAIAWTMGEEALKLELTVPPETSAVLDPPEGWETDTRDIEPGLHTMELGRGE